MTSSQLHASDSDISLDLDLEEKINPRDLVLTACSVKPVGTLPKPRCGHSLSVFGNKVFLFGGADKDVIFGESYIFDLGTTRWDVAPTSGFSCPGPLFAHTATVVDDQLFLFGGLTLSSTYKFEGHEQNSTHTPASAKDTRYSGPRGGLFSKRDEETTNELFTFDFASLQWAQSLSSGEVPCGRYLHTACAIGRLMVVFGGCSKPGYKGSLADIYVYDTGSSKWSCPNLNGNPPARRHGHTATHIGDGKMLVFGGAQEQAVEDSLLSLGAAAVTVRRFNDAHILDTKTWTWSKVSAHGSPPAPRAFHSAGIVQEQRRLLYIYGGETDRGTADLCVLDLDRMRWCRPLSDAPVEVQMHSSAVVANKFFVFGGLSVKRGLLDDSCFLNTVTIRAAETNDLTFKLILAGNSEVGKSCLLTRFVEDRYADMHVSTIGVDFKTVTTLVDGKVVKLHLWDTAGQERFAQVTSHYYRGAHGAILVYDITNPASFANIDSWYGSIDNANPSSEVAILVVGNKLDLESQRKVSFDDGRSLARRLKGQFVETSAKDSANVDIAFMQLAKALVARQRQSDDRSRSANISLNKSTGGNSTKCCN